MQLLEYYRRRALKAVKPLVQILLPDQGDGLCVLDATPCRL